MHAALFANYSRVVALPVHNWGKGMLFVVSVASKSL